MRSDLEAVQEVLRQSRGPITRGAIRRATGLPEGKVNSAVMILTYTDHHLAEDDHGALLYVQDLPSRS